MMKVIRTDDALDTPGLTTLDIGRCRCYIQKAGDGTFRLEVPFGDSCRITSDNMEDAVLIASTALVRYFVGLSDALLADPKVAEAVHGEENG